MRLSTVVMTHPRRLAAARRLAEGLDDAVDVVVDPRPDDQPSTLRTAVLAWDHCDGAATHHLVLQDDVIPAERLCERARQATGRHPDRMIALYANSQSWNGAASRPALLAGYGWIATTPSEYFPTVATIMPCAVAHEFTAQARAVLAVERNDDEALSRFIASSGVRTALCLPNLVEHDDQPSVMGYDFHGIRRSVAFEARPSVAGDRADGPLLETLPAWPAFLRRRAFLRLPPRPGGRRWRTLTRPAHLRLVDQSWAEVCGEAEACLASFASVPQRRSVARVFVRELYLAAFTLGRVVAAVPHHPAARPVPGEYLDLALRSYLDTGLGFASALVPWRAELPVLLKFASAAFTRGTAAGPLTPAL